MANGLDNLARELIDVSAIGVDPEAAKGRERIRQGLRGLDVATVPGLQRDIQESVGKEFAVNPFRLKLASEVGDARFKKRADEIFKIKDNLTKLSVKGFKDISEGAVAAQPAQREFSVDIPSNQVPVDPANPKKGFVSGGKYTINLKDKGFTIQKEGEKGLTRSTSGEHPIVQFAQANRLLEGAEAIPGKKGTVSSTAQQEFSKERARLQNELRVARSRFNKEVPSRSELLALLEAQKKKKTGAGAAKKDTFFDFVKTIVDPIFTPDKFIDDLKAAGMSDENAAKLVNRVGKTGFSALTELVANAYKATNVPINEATAVRGSEAYTNYLVTQIASMNDDAIRNQVSNIYTSGVTKNQQIVQLMGKLNDFARRGAGSKNPDHVFRRAQNTLRLLGTSPLISSEEKFALDQVRKLDTADPAKKKQLVNTANLVLRRIMQDFNNVSLNTGSGVAQDVVNILTRSNSTAQTKLREGLSFTAPENYQSVLNTVKELNKTVYLPIIKSVLGEVSEDDAFNDSRKRFLNDGANLFTRNKTTFNNFADIYSSDLGLSPDELDSFREQTGAGFFDIKEKFRPNE